MSAIQNIVIVVSCPNCGAEDYEFDLDSDDLGAQVSMPCDECPKRVSVSIDVIVESTEGADA